MRTRLDLLVIGALAVYRAWRFVARDAITQRWREALYDRFPPSYQRSLARSEWNSKMHEVVMHTRPSNRSHPKVSWVTASLACPWCLGTWLSAALTAAVDASFGLTWPILWWLALSALVGLLGRADG
jgi:hypothetical protein